MSKADEMFEKLGYKKIENHQEKEPLKASEWRFCLGPPLAAGFYQISVFLRLKVVCSYSDLRCPKRYVLFSVPCSKRAMLERWV